PVRADGADDGDDRHGRHREVQRGVFVAAQEPGHDPADPPRQFLRLHDVVDDDLDGPRLEDVRDRLAEHRHERQRQWLPVRTEHEGNPQIRRLERRRTVDGTWGHDGMRWILPQYIIANLHSWRLRCDTLASLCSWRCCRSRSLPIRRRFSDAGISPAPRRTATASTGSK